MELLAELLARGGGEGVEPLGGMVMCAIFLRVFLEACSLQASLQTAQIGRSEVRNPMVKILEYILMAMSIFSIHEYEYEYIFYT